MFDNLFDTDFRIDDPYFFKNPKLRKLSSKFNDLKYRIRNFPHTYKQFVFLNKNKYNQYLLWNLCDYIPRYICLGTQAMLNSNVKPYPVHDDIKNREEWEEVLKTIHDGFKTYDYQSGVMYTDEQIKEMMELRHKAFVLLEKYLDNLWD